MVITALTRNPPQLRLFRPPVSLCFQGFSRVLKTKYFAVLTRRSNILVFPLFWGSMCSDRVWHTRRGIEVVITGLTRNRNRFVERSTRKSLDLCRFSRVRKRKNLWVLPISSPHFPKRIGWRYNLEGCPSGRRCDSRKVVCRKAPRVRIPNPPPTWEAGFAGFSFLFPVSYP